MATACTNGIDLGFVDLGSAKAAALGAVQGITDLLPLSAAVHLRLMPTVLGWAGPGPAFAAAMQLGAFLAIVAYFHRDVWALSRGGFEAVRSGDHRSFEFRTLVGIAIATLPMAVGWPLVRRHFDFCGAPARELWVLGTASVGLAVLLAAAALVRRHERPFEEIRLRDAVVAGLAQAVALIPGVSRSGAALTAALFMNLKRTDAVRWSFLVGLPAIAGVGLKGLLDLRKAGIGVQGWEVVGAGLVATTITAFLAIWIAMKVIERFSVWPFVAYRIVIGGFLLLVVWLEVLA